GEAPAAIRLIETKEEAEKVEVPDPEHVAYLTQTTLSLDDTRDILDVLKRRFPKLAGPAKADICYATQNRQATGKSTAPHVDALLVLGAPNSSNSLRLCEVAQSIGVPAYLIERAADIRPEWLENVRVLGLTASASAPEILVQEVVEFARNELGVKDVREFETVQEDVNFALPQELTSLLKTHRPGFGSTGPATRCERALEPSAPERSNGAPRVARARCRRHRPSPSCGRLESDRGKSDPDRCGPVCLSRRPLRALAGGVRVWLGALDRPSPAGEPAAAALSPLSRRRCAQFARSGR